MENTDDDQDDLQFKYQVISNDGTLLYEFQASPDPDPFIPKGSNKQNEEYKIADQHDAKEDQQDSVQSVEDASNAPSDNNDTAAEPPDIIPEDSTKKVARKFKIRSNGSGRLSAFPCKNCSKVFQKLAHLQNHYRANHRQGLEPTCKHCGLDYIKECKLPEESQSSSEQFQCLMSQCHQKFANLADLRNHHIRKCRMQSQRHLNVCPHCKKSFYRKSNLKAHIDGVHLKKFKLICDSCGAGFNALANLRVHRERLHMTDAEKGFSCDICGLAFTARSKLDRHKGKHQEIHLFCCLDCGESFKLLAQYRSHCEATHSRGSLSFKCQLCNEFQSTAVGLHRHYQRWHPAEPETHVCDQCGESYPTLSLLKRHQQYEEMKKRRETGAESNQCTDCDKIFPGWKDLEAHVIEVHGKEMAKKKSDGRTCHICRKDFSSWGQLQFHMENVHNPKQLPCPVCTGTFQAVRYLKIHLRNTHSQNWRDWIDGTTGSMLKTVEDYPEFQDLELKCDICPKVFKSEHCLKEHQRLIHLSEPANCPLCHREFKNKKQCRNHVKKKHKVDPREWFVEKTGESVVRADPGPV